MANLKKIIENIVKFFGKTETTPFYGMRSKTTAELSKIEFQQFMFSYKHVICL